MPRNGPAARRELAPDPVYRSVLVTQVVNKILSRGKRSLAERIVYEALDVVADKTGGDAVATLKRALDNARPELEVRSRRVGGANYQVPMQVNRKRQQSLAFRWIIEAARSEKGKPMYLRLSKELMDAFNNEGKAVTTRLNTQKMAEANRAFAHYRW